MGVHDIKINIKAMDGITDNQVEAITKAFNEIFPTKNTNLTASAKKLKDAIKQSEYDQCNECGGRRFERVVNRVIITSGYYFKAGILKERPPKDNKGTHGKTSKLRCSNCKTIYNQKERKEDLCSVVLAK